MISYINGRTLKRDGMYGEILDKDNTDREEVTRDGKEFGISLESVFGVASQGRGIHLGDSTSGHMLFGIHYGEGAAVCRVKPESGCLGATSRWIGAKNLPIWSQSSSDNQIIVAQGSYQSPYRYDISLFDCLSGGRIGCLFGHYDEITNIIPFSSSSSVPSSSPQDGQSDGENHDMVLSSSFDHSIRVWDLESGVEKAIFKDHWIAAGCLCVDPFGRRLIGSDQDCAKPLIRVWSIENQGQILVIKCHSAEVNCVAFGKSPEYRHVFTCSSDGTAKMISLSGSNWTKNTYAVSKTFTHDASVVCCCLGLEDHLLWTGTRSGGMWCWDVRKESACLHNVNYNEYQVNQIKRESENRLLSCYDTGLLYVCESSLKLTRKIETGVICSRGLVSLSWVDGRNEHSFANEDEEERIDYLFSESVGPTRHLLTIRLLIATAWSGAEINNFRSLLI